MAAKESKDHDCSLPTDQLRASLEQDVNRTGMFRVLLNNLCSHQDYKPDVVLDAKLFQNRYHGDPHIKRLLQLNARITDRHLRFARSASKGHRPQTNQPPPHKNVSLIRTYERASTSQPQGDREELYKQILVESDKFLKRLRPRGAAKNSKCSNSYMRDSFSSPARSKPMTAVPTPNVRGSLAHIVSHSGAQTSTHAMLSSLSSVANMQGPTKRLSTTIYRSFLLSANKKNSIPEDGKRVRVIQGLNELIHCDEPEDSVLYAT